MPDGYQESGNEYRTEEKMKGSRSILEEWSYVIIQLRFRATSPGNEAQKMV